MPSQIVSTPLASETVSIEIQCTQPKQAQLLVEVRLVTCDGDVLDDIPVACERLGEARNTQLGLVDYGMVAPDDYTIEVQRDGYRYVQDQQTSPGFNQQVMVQAGNKVKVIVALEPQVSLFLDADRIGDTTALTNIRLKDWTWGENGRGAIALCNDNDSDSTRTPDNTDRRINGANDLQDIAPLDVRSRLTPTQIRDLTNPQILLSFVVSTDAARLRIFNGRQPTSTELLGPTAAEADLMAIWNTAVAIDGYPSCLELGMEAIRYDLDANETPIQLRVRLIVSGIELVKVDGSVRVAPWMMQHHLITPLEIYAVQGARKKQNGAFLDALDQVRPGNVPHVWLPFQGGDLWGQDCMEFGSSCLPLRTVSTVVPGPRRTGFAPFVVSLLSDQIGFFNPLQHQPQGDRDLRSSDSSQDKLGNLEITPPLPGYPFGRIYYGRGRDSMDPRIVRFLYAQRVQAPFELDVSWLDVGHVDEVISFVPCAEGGAWTCTADPTLATDLLSLAASIDPDGILLRERYLRGSEGEGGGLPGWTLLRDCKCMPDYDKIMQMNQEAAPRMKVIRETLVANGVDQTRFLSVPTLFGPGRMGGTGFFTTDMVNMVVLDRECIAAKPFGPEIHSAALKDIDAFLVNLADWLQGFYPNTFPLAKPLLAALKFEWKKFGELVDIFELVMAGMFGALGLTVHFVDDWEHYHSGGGEVHCGTNVRREPQLVRWWTIDLQTIEKVQRSAPRRQQSAPRQLGLPLGQRPGSRPTQSRSLISSSPYGLPGGSIPTPQRSLPRQQRTPLDDSRPPQLSASASSRKPVPRSNPTSVTPRLQPKPASITGNKQTQDTNPEKKDKQF